ncbi:MAG: hypothetical protein IT447_02965 [Phycisphaerales bacterium]|jgi:putative transcriptional regulator|nr:hypothetical protein [Phycisphaerales bacterium]
MTANAGSKRRLGKRLVAEFGALRDALRDRKRIEKIYTVRTVRRIEKPKDFDDQSVRVIRMSLGVSQAVFAMLLDVSVDLVAAWEQGLRTPSGPVRRLLELMEEDKEHWLRKLERGDSRKTA